MEVSQKTLLLTVEKGSLQVKVGKKLSYSDDPEANLLKRPLNFRIFDENLLEGLFQAAERNHKERNYDLALTKYLACLEREPFHARALVRAAEIYCSRGEYDKGLPFVQKALDHTMYDPDANYIYGVISRKLGRLVDAKETLGWAARSMKYRSAAYCQMAEIYIMEDQLDLALEHTKRSLDYNVYNVKAYQVQATTYRLLEQPELARQTLQELLDLDPLNHLARFEQYLLQPNAENLVNFKSLIRNEMPHETYLDGDGLVLCESQARRRCREGPRCSARISHNPVLVRLSPERQKSCAEQGIAGKGLTALALPGFSFPGRVYSRLQVGQRDAAGRLEAGLLSWPDLLG